MILYVIAVCTLYIALNGMPILNWNGGVVYFLCDFSIQFLKFLFGIANILFAFSFHMIYQTFGAVTTCIPFLLRIMYNVYIVCGFLSWTFRQMIKGIFGCGNYFLSTISWLTFTCICVLYFAHIFQGPEDIQEQLQINLEQRNRENPSREGEQASREYLENEQNENEENNLEEAEINTATDDNVRNTVRERLIITTHNQNLNRDLDVVESEEISDSESEANNESPRNQRNRNERQVGRDHGFFQQQGTDRSVDNYLCSVCFEQERNIAVFPCGHMNLCNTCVHLVMRQNRLCPICRTQIEEFRRVYLQ